MAPYGSSKKIYPNFALLICRPNLGDFLCFIIILREAKNFPTFTTYSVVYSVVLYGI